MYSGQNERISLDNLPKEILTNIILLIDDPFPITLINNYFFQLIQNIKNVIWEERCKKIYFYLYQSVLESEERKSINWKEKYEEMKEIEEDISYFVKKNDPFKHAKLGKGFFKKIVDDIKINDFSMLLIHLYNKHEEEIIFAVLNLVRKLKNLKMLDQIYNSNEIKLDKIFLSIACQRSLFEIFILQGESGLSDDELLKAAVKFAHWDLIKHLIENKNLNCSKLEILEKACFYGHIQIVKYFIEKNVDFHSIRIFNEMFGLIPRSNFSYVSIHLIKYLFSKGMPTAWESEYQKIISMPRLDQITGELRESWETITVKQTHSAFEQACELGSLSLVEFFVKTNKIDNHVYSLNEALRDAVLKNQYRIADFLIRQGASLDYKKSINQLNENDMEISDSDSTFEEAILNYFYNDGVSGLMASFLLIKKINPQSEIFFNEEKKTESYLEILKTLLNLTREKIDSLSIDGLDVLQLYKRLIIFSYINYLKYFSKDVMKTSEKKLSAQSFFGNSGNILSLKLLPQIKIFSNLIDEEMNFDELTFAEREGLNLLKDHPVYLLYYNCVEPVLSSIGEVNEIPRCRFKME